MSGETETVAQGLVRLNESLTGPERSNLKLLLGMAAGGLIDDGEPPRDDVGARAFGATTSCIARLQRRGATMPSNGIAYRGRPDFITDGLLDQLRAESRAMRSQAVRFDDHYVATGAPFARQTALSEQLSDVVGDHVPHIRPTAKANYLYYDEPGLGIEPHVDNEGFSLNVILMLEHLSERPEKSALVVYPPGEEPERIVLAEGEMVIMFADSVAHARERVREDERIRIAAFGFQPLTSTGDGT
jgi:hypothetical protein